MIAAKQLLLAAGKSEWMKKERPGAQPSSVGVRDSGKAHIQCHKKCEFRQIRIASLCCWDLVTSRGCFYLGEVREGKAGDCLPGMSQGGAAGLPA